MSEQAFSTGEQSFFTVGERGVLVRIKAKPHAREDAVLGVRGGELLVSVRAAPEKGRANEEIIRVVASALGVPRASVTLKSGGASPHKVLLLPPETLPSLRTLASRQGHHAYGKRAAGAGSDAEPEAPPSP